MTHAQYATSTHAEAAAAADVIQCDVSGRIFCWKVASRIFVTPAVLLVNLAQLVWARAMLINQLTQKLKEYVK